MHVALLRSTFGLVFPPAVGELSTLFLRVRRDHGVIGVEVFGAYLVR